MSLPAITVAYPDAPQWDRFCDTHEYGHLLQKSDWGMVKRTTGWDDVRIAVYDDGLLCAGAQVLTRRRYGVALCYVPRGPLLCDDHLINQALIAAITAYAKRQRAIAVRYEPNVVATDLVAHAYTRVLATHHCQTSSTLQPQHTIYTALDGDNNQLLKRMTKGHRAAIKRAQRDGVSVRIGYGTHDLKTFMDIMRHTGQRNAFDVHQQDYYAQVWQRFGSHNNAILLIAEYQGAPVAAAMIVAHPHVACYLYGGSYEAAFTCGANHLIQWHALCWARDRGCQHYDAWGIPYPSHTPPEGEIPQMAGLILFKKGFGGSDVSFLPAHTQVLMPWVYRLVAQRLSH